MNDKSTKSIFLSTGFSKHTTYPDRKAKGLNKKSLIEEKSLGASLAPNEQFYKLFIH